MSWVLILSRKKAVIACFTVMTNFGWFFVDLSLFYVIPVISPFYSSSSEEKVLFYVT
jgi:hypothetical protein